MGRAGFFLALALIASGLVVCGCGQKGDLYLPPDKQEQSP
jgi:predicted small lipoprotein YifL